jgi:hypothetical protein
VGNHTHVIPPATSSPWPTVAYVAVRIGERCPNARDLHWKVSAARWRLVDAIVMAAGRLRVRSRSGVLVEPPLPKVFPLTRGWVTTASSPSRRTQLWCRYHVVQARPHVGQERVPLGHGKHQAVIAGFWPEDRHLGGMRR